MARTLIGAVVGALVLALAAPGVALAGPAALMVTNAAQPGLESDVPQPPVSLAARGSCATPYSAQEANTGMSSCAPGSWPPNDVRAGGDWSPEVRVAGGDRLELAFDVPAEQVRYSSTTNFPRGLRDPSGAPHPNVDIISARDAQPTTDARMWTIELPRFDDTGHPPGSGYTFSVVARAGTTWRSFAFSIKAPRWNNHQTRCGFFDNPGEFNRTFCMFSYLPGPPPLGADRRPPSLRVQVPRRQRVLRQRQAIAYARCDEICTVRITGRLRAAGRSYKLRGATKVAPARTRVLLGVRLTPGAARALRRALRGHRRATIVLATRARDASGNGSALTRRTLSFGRRSDQRSAMSSHAVPAGGAVSLAGSRRDAPIFQRVSDRDDVAGPLDIAAASVGVRPARRGRPGVLLLRMRTHARWASSTLAGGGIAPRYLAFEFDRGRAATRDRCLEIMARPGEGLAAQMTRPVCAIVFSKAIGQPVRVKRRGPRAIELTLPLGYLGRRPLSRRFRATSSFEAPGHLDCPPPDYPPPERSFGSCRDVTRWARIARLR